MARIHREQVNVRFPPDLVKAAKDHADRGGVTLTSVLQDALTAFLFAPEEERVESLERRVSALEEMANRY